MKRVFWYVQCFEKKFAKQMQDKSIDEQRKELSRKHRELEKIEKRIAELDNLFLRIYEDMVSGRLSESRFDILSSEYEQEQRSVKQRIAELEDLIEHGEEKFKDLKQLLANVRKYTDPQELTPEMLNDLVDKIVIHAPVKSNGRRTQKIEIYYNAVGIIDLPITILGKVVELRGKFEII